LVRIVFILFFAISLISFSENEESPYVIILGTAQDGGAPHAACQKVCCLDKSQVLELLILNQMMYG
jgi:hypothetical protein